LDDLVYLRVLDPDIITLQKNAEAVLIWPLGNGLRSPLLEISSPLQPETHSGFGGLWEIDSALGDRHFRFARYDF
jgi:hypothetical protein